jgi:hypothetical protein
MKRTAATLIGILALCSTLAVGYLAGGRPLSHGAAVGQDLADERTAAAFYQALEGLEEPAAQERLAALLAPDFTDQRIDIQQTLGREAFLQAVAQEARTFPERALVPIRIGSDSGWVVATVQTVDATPGSFGSISLPPSAIVRTELLHVEHGRMTSRVVLKGSGSLLRSLAPVKLHAERLGSLTIKISQRDYAAHSEEYLVLPVDALIVVDLGQLIIGSSGARTTVDEGTSFLGSAGQELTIANESDAPARILTLFTSLIETPSVAADANQPQESAPGITVTMVGQSRYFVPDHSCFAVIAGHAAMAAGMKLPSHRTVGYEMVVPTSGELEASNQNTAFLRTDSEQQWQDELPFVRLTSGSSATAPPESWTTYSVSGNAPARFWIFTVESAPRC